MMISSQPLTFEILRSVDNGVAPHHRSPASATEPAGQDLLGVFAARVSDSTAPIAGKCQSFLDNVLAQFVGIRARNYRSGTLRSPSCAVFGLFAAVCRRWSLCSTRLCARPAASRRDHSRSA